MNVGCDGVDCCDGHNSHYGCDGVYHCDGYNGCDIMNK